MQGFTSGEKRVLADLFTTIAAAWFAAGVISSVFIRSRDPFELFYNFVVGLLFTYLSTRVALSLGRNLK